MLPSPLGLLEYDVLEDGVFLGPDARRGLRAAPTPFRGACVALTRSGNGFVVRPLPGETPPLVNDEAVSDAALADGDRIRIGEQVVLFRAHRGPLEPQPTAPDGGREREGRAPPARRPNRRRWHPAVTVLAFGGLVLVLAAVYRAVAHVKAIRSAELPKTALGEVPGQAPTPAPRSARAYEEVRELARRSPGQHAVLVSRYEAFQRAYEGTPEADMATDEIRSLMDAWGREERAAMEKQVETLVGAHQFARALKTVRDFESRFGATAAADGVQTLRTSIRAQARTSLDALIAKAGPLITRQPREAHRLLISVNHEFPADMAVEVIGLLERAVARMIAVQAERRSRPPGRPAPTRPPPTDLPPWPTDDEPGPGTQPTPGPRRDDPQPDRQALDAWDAARSQLLQGQYADALMSYTLLTQQYGNTAAYRTHKAKIAAGRYAAKVGAHGPAGMLLAPAEVKKGRLEVEYEFNDLRILEEDWTQEQPFSSEMPIEIKWSRGSVLMEKASGLLHKLVYLPDVRIEVRLAVRQPHDFGLLAVQESDDFRAILFNVGNTKFMIGKGASTRANPGHVLWYIGQGVWSRAEKDAHGFIKIAERSHVKLESGDRLKVEFVRKKDACEGTFQGKTDGVHLEGRVKGDDGSTMGPGRIGVFTNSGIIEVESARISGVVDMEWFRKQLEFLVAADPGPPADR